MGNREKQKSRIGGSYAKIDKDVDSIYCLYGNYCDNA